MREADRAPSISRRDFLRRATVFTAGAAVAVAVGDEVLEAFERLANRPALVPSWGISRATYPNWEAGKPVVLTEGMIRRAVASIWTQHQPEIAKAYTIDYSPLARSPYLKWRMI